MHRLLRSRIAVLVLTLACASVVSCSKDNPVGPPAVASVIVTPGTDTLATLGRTRQFTAVAQDANGNPVSVTLVWHSTNPAVATVDSATGIVTAVANGSTVIRADAGGVIGQAPLAVVQVVAGVVVSPPSAGFTSVGDTQRLAAVAKDSGAAIVPGVRFLWQSSDQAVATVDTGGLLRSKGPGQTFITAAGRGVPGYGVVTVTQVGASLVFSVGPTTGEAGEAVNPAIEVEVHDSSGHLVSGARSAITLAFGANPGGAVLHGSTTVNAVGGVATFSGITVETADSGYTLVASAGGMTPGTSPAFHVLPAAPKALQWVAQAATDSAGQALPFTVRAVDRFGNFTPSVVGAVIIRLSTNPTGATLVNGNSFPVMTGGIADLSASILSMQKAGVGYRFVATGGGGAAGLDSAFSQLLTVAPATATHLFFTHLQSGQTLGGALFTTAVAFQDVFGNAVDTSATVTLGLGSNPWQAALLGTLAVPGTGSVAYGPITINKPGLYTVVASAPGFVPETSATVTITMSTVSQLAAGANHTCAVSLGVSLCWGDNSFGQLGRTGGGADSVAAIVPGGQTFAQLAAGDQHSCGLTSGGTAYCWGGNGLGQLGTGSGASEIDSATTVTGGHLFTAISAGSKHTCAIASDSTAYCWGDNSTGALGDSGREASTSTPVPVYGGRKFVAIAAGGRHTCGVGADSSAYCWGDDGLGQLGDSVASGTSDTAVRVVRGHKFKTVAAGDSHTCAVATNTVGYCWGSNSHGQLGDHHLGVNSDTAVAVVGVSFATLSAGGAHTCGRQLAGSAYCWGSNANGQLGYGTPPTDNDQPATVSLSFGISLIVAGGNHSCAMEFKLYCWGKNALGQLGDTTTTDRAAPAQVFKQ